MVEVSFVTSALLLSALASGPFYMFATHDLDDVACAIQST